MSESVKSPVGCREPKRSVVNVGRISMFRLVESPVIPSRTPICGKKPATSRETGDHTTVSFFPRMLRAI